MKRSILTVVVLLSLILCSFSVYAADGDLIVNGKVGIGTTAPQTSLHVAGDITLGNTNDGIVQGIHRGTSSGSDGSVLVLSGAGAPLGINDSSRGAYLDLLGNNIDWLGGCAILGAGDSAGNLSAVALATKSEVRVYVSSEGNVGIGTITPEATLDVSGTVKAFGGDWTTKTLGQAFLAESDGFVVANIIATSATNATTNLRGLTDSSNPPSSNSIRAYAHCAQPTDTGGSFTMPVKKGDYWQVVKPDTTPATVTIYWMPLGHQ
jgi:hypothetical protein